MVGKVKVRFKTSAAVVASHPFQPSSPWGWQPWGWHSCFQTSAKTSSFSPWMETPGVCLGNVHTCYTNRSKQQILPIIFPNQKKLASLDVENNPAIICTHIFLQENTHGNRLAPPIPTAPLCHKWHPRVVHSHHCLKPGKPQATRLLQQGAGEKSYTQNRWNGRDIIIEIFHMIKVLNRFWDVLMYNHVVTCLVRDMVHQQ